MMWCGHSPALRSQTTGLNAVGNLNLQILTDSYQVVLLHADVMECDAQTELMGSSLCVVVFR